MNRRGFLGALTAGLASLGIVWPAKRVTATGVDRALCREQFREFAELKVKASKQEFRWLEEKVVLPAEDTLYWSVSLKETLLMPSNPDRWKAGDVWQNLETREVFYVKWTYPEGTVQVMRGTGGGASMISTKDRLLLVGSQGIEKPVKTTTGVMEHIRTNSSWPLYKGEFLTEKQFTEWLDAAMKTKTRS